MKCPHCGNKLDPIEPGVIRCHKCGNPVDVEPSDIKPEADRQLAKQIEDRKAMTEASRYYHKPG